VQAALDKVAQNRTTITIAHRLSTIKKADCILVLQKGRVVETGTHESLLENDEGVYTGLVRAQQLSLGEGAQDSDDEVHEEEDIGAILSREKSAAKSEADSTTKRADGKQRGFLGSIVKLMLEQKNRLPWYITTIIASAGCGAAIPLVAFLFAKVIVVFEYANDPPKMSDESNFYGIMWTVLAVGIGVAYFVMGATSTHTSHHVSAAYRKSYFEDILFQKTPFFDQDENSQGSLTARVSGDPKQIEEMMGLNMGMVYNAIFGLIGGIIIAFFYTWKLAIVALCITSPILLVATYWRFRYEIEFDKMNAEVFEESSKFAAEAIGAFRTVASLTLEGPICDRYEKLLGGHVTTAFKKALWASAIFGFSDSATIGCQALIFYYGSRLLAKHDIDVMAFFVTLMAIMQGAETAGQGFSFGPNAAQATAASNRILNMRETRNRDTISDSEGIPDADGGIKIELKDVHFKYPTRNMNVFKGLNLTIEKGQFAALVGASGCGKTSIVSLLERFYEPHRGEILANGRNINDVNVYSYRKYLSLVAQEPTLLQGTIKDNILLGVDPETITEERLHAVCRDASIHDFIVSLPEGYNTDIGSKGVSLSGGQKQRVAIARALIRDPSVLLLDEATSSLDSESEKLVQAAFERAGKGRTMVVVAHRLATVQNADVIFVLGEGKLLEKGTHGELLKKKGVYWNMVSCPSVRSVSCWGIFTDFFLQCHSQALDR